MALSLSAVDQPADQLSETSVRDAQRHILEGILRGLSLLGFFALVAAGIGTLQNAPPERQTIAIVVVSLFVLAYLILVLVTLVPRLPYAVRASVLLFLLYSVALVDLLQQGLSSNGQLFLFAFVTLTAVLFDARKGIGALLLSIATLAVVAGVLTTGQIVIPTALLANSTRANSWLTMVLVFMLLAITSFVSMGYLIRRLSVAVDSERAARHAAQDAQRAAQQAEAAAAQAARLEEVERQLRELVRTLETPVVVLADGLLLAPLVGAVDTERAQALTERLLHAVAMHRAQLIAVDLTGMGRIDAAVAQSLVQLAQAIRLLGCRVVLTGISAAHAVTLSQLGLHQAELLTAQSPQDVLIDYLAQRTAQTPF